MIFFLKVAKKRCPSPHIGIAGNSEESPFFHERLLHLHFPRQVVEKVEEKERAEEVEEKEELEGKNEVEKVEEMEEVEVMSRRGGGGGEIFRFLRAMIFVNRAIPPLYRCAD